MNRSLMVCGLLLTLCVGVSGAEEPAAQTLVPVDHATSFFEILLSDEWQEAPAKLLAGSGIIQSDPEAANKILEQVTQRHEILGAPLGYELITNDEIGTSVVRLLFVLKFESKPVAWEFYYYKASDTWELANLSVLPDFRVIRHR